MSSLLSSAVIFDQAEYDIRCEWGDGGLAQLAAFESANTHSLNLPLRGCSAGKELIERGVDLEIDLLARSDVDTCAPIVLDGAYRSGLGFSAGIG